MHPIEREIDLGGWIVGHLARCGIDPSHAGNEKTVVSENARRRGLVGREIRRMNRRSPFEVADRNRVDLNRWMRQSVDSEDRTSRRSLWEILAEYAIHLGIRADVRHVDLNVDDVVESQSRCFRDGLDVVEDLPELCLRGR